MECPVFPVIKCLMVVLGLTAGICRAGLGSIDWEYGVAQAICAPTWTYDGLLVTNARGTICVNSSPFVSNNTQSANDVAGLVVRHVNGKNFTPISIDLGEYYSASNTDDEILFIGYKSGGEAVSTGFELDLIADGAGGADDFQTFTFPPEFADIVRLEVPNTKWRFDNLTFSTVIPPALPADQRLGPALTSAIELYSKSIHDNTLVIGADYQFVSGFQPTAPSKTKFLAPEGTAFLSSTPSCYYDRADKALYYKPTNSYSIKKSKAGVVSDAADLHDPLGLGISVQSISKPRAAGGRLLFMGSNTNGGDSYHVFEKKNGVTTALITPLTQLPIGNSTSTPRYFPREIIIRPDGYAFDTSLDSSPTDWRLYASFKGGPVRYVIGETDTIPMGENYDIVKDIERFEYTPSGEIKVRAQMRDGLWWLFFNDSGYVRREEVFITVSPENAGRQVTGERFPTVVGTMFLDTHEEIFQEHDGRFFRVVGVGDQINGETISYLEYKATRETLPLRVLVEVRYQSSAGMARILELAPAPPVHLPPRFGATFVHPESGDLFIPLSHLTHGREYRVRGSTNLRDWTDLWGIETVVPLQHVVIPPDRLDSPSFFRVEER
jgi:hypothetical protein